MTRKAKQTKAEKTGARVIGKPDVLPPVKKPVKLRYFYRSQGGEELCCDSMSMSSGRAQKEIAYYSQLRAFNATDCIAVVVANGTPAQDFQTRRVDLPSQMSLLEGTRPERTESSSWLRSFPSASASPESPSHRCRLATSALLISSTRSITPP